MRLFGSDVWDASIHLQDYIGNHRGVFGSDVWDASMNLQDYTGNHEAVWFGRLGRIHSFAGLHQEPFPPSKRAKGHRAEGGPRLPVGPGETTANFQNGQH